MKRTFTFLPMILFISLTLILPPAALADEYDPFTFMVSPAKIETTAQPGETYYETINVTNQGPVPMTIDTGVGDFAINSDSSVQFFEVGQQPQSSAPWISLDPASFLLKAGESRAVTVSVAVPADAGIGGRNAMVFFQNLRTGDGGGGIDFIGRIGAPILTTIGDESDIERGGMITEFTISNGWLDRSSKPKVIFQNTGNVHITIRGEVVFTDLFGRRVGEVPLQEITVLANSERQMNAEWFGPFVGRFTSQATIWHGPDQFTFTTANKTELVTFWIVPWRIILAMIGFVALYGIGGNYFENRRKARALESTGEQSSDPGEGAEPVGSATPPDPKE